MEEIKKEKGAKGSTSFKIRKLQKQYNKILTDLFDKYAAESIEEALDGSTASFGENITDIVQHALNNLRTKVLEELGVEYTQAVEVPMIGNMFSDVPASSMEVVMGDKDEEDESKEHEDEENEEDTEDTEPDADTEEDDEADSDEDSAIEEARRCRGKMKRKMM